MKTTNRYIKTSMPAILALLLALLTFNSCEKFLEVESEFKFRAEIALESLENMQKAATGMLDMLQRSSLYAGGLVANSELLADNVSPNNISDFSLNQFITYDMNAFNGEVAGLWNDAYHAIHRANVILANADRFRDEDPVAVAIMEGEAYFMRGIMHFELVRMFAQPWGYTADNAHLGVPIRLFPGSIEEGQNIPRATVKAVYEQVISDLKQAEQLLPDNPTARISSWAATAFLARVYFQQNDFQNALDNADRVINSGHFALEDSLLAPFNTTDGAFSSEVIFQVINMSDDFNTGSLGRFRQTVGTPPYRVSDLFADIVDADQIGGGLRSKKWFKLFGGKYYTTKYDNDKMNIPVIRLAEMYLIRAECNAQLGAPDAVVRADYNKLRVRGGLPPDHTTTGKDNLLDIIHYERNLELCFEGDRFHDLKRRQQDFQTHNGVIPWNDWRLVYPIPQQEVEQNPNMVQNPGY